MKRTAPPFITNLDFSFLIWGTDRKICFQLPKTCRLTNLNINTQIQQHNTAQPPRLHINGNATFTISLKDEVAGD